MGKIMPQIPAGFRLHDGSASGERTGSLASDAEIIDAVRSGDRAAYAHLVRRYRRAVLAVTLHVLGEFHAAEDAAQEAFIAAFRRLNTLRDPRRFRAWLLEM